MEPLHLRNITRFTYEFTSFLGWRLTLCRSHIHFTRYFSDRQYGGEEASLAAALEVRERVMELLRLHPDDPAKAFEQCKTAGPPKLYPDGLEPLRLRKTAHGTQAYL